MKNITFSHNWNNKLNNQVFSTIRMLRDDKRYYEDKEGAVFNVILKNKLLFTARLLISVTFKFKDIPEWLLMLDTGQPTIEAARKVFFSFYGNLTGDEEFAVCLFHRLSYIKGSQ